MGYELHGREILDGDGVNNHDHSIMTDERKDAHTMTFDGEVKVCPQCKGVLDWGWTFRSRGRLHVGISLHKHISESLQDLFDDWQFNKECEC